MQIKFLAASQQVDYTITDNNINGVDFTGFIPGSLFVGNEQTHAAGIINAYHDINDELVVVLQQACLSYEYPVASHDWKESAVIPASKYDPAICYIIPMSVQNKHDYYTEFVTREQLLPNGETRIEQGWTVKQIQPESAIEETANDVV